MTPARTEVLELVAGAVEAAKPADHPMRVAIDGRSTAGKSTFAPELAAELVRRGHDTLVASMDDFHRRGHRERSIRRDWTPESYFDDGYDYAAFVEFLLAPLGPGGSRRCQPRLNDSLHDQPFPVETTTVTRSTFAVIEAGFAAHPEIADCWDYVIWLDISFETMVERAASRDVAWAGPEAVVRDRYTQFWIPTHELYEARCDPGDRADCVIDNSDVDNPRIVRI